LQDGSFVITITAPETIGNCNNVLYPLEPGSNWTYQARNNGNISLISLVVKEAGENQAAVQMVDNESGNSKEYTIFCEDGAILNFLLLL
jgi:hypothetical protein